MAAVELALFKMLQYIMKAILAKIPNKKLFRRALDAQMQLVGKLPQEDLETYVAPWDDPPIIQIILETKPNEISVFAGVESNWTKGKKATPEDHLMFVSRGTKVRYAVMTSDFSPKTQPGLLRSSSGRGGLLTVNKNNPQQGIKARNVEENLAKKQKQPIKQGTQLALEISAQAIGWMIR